MKWLILTILIFLIPLNVYASPFLISDPNPSCENGICDVEFTGLTFTPPPADLKTQADGSIRIDMASLPEGDAINVQIGVSITNEFGTQTSAWVPFVHSGRSKPSAPAGLAVSP